MNRCESCGLTAPLDLDEGGWELECVYGGSHDFVEISTADLDYEVMIIIGGTRSRQRMLGAGRASVGPTLSSRLSSAQTARHVLTRRVIRDRRRNNCRAA